MGRKATGPSGTAGLPKQKEFCGPVVYTETGPFVWVRHLNSRRGRTKKNLGLDNPFAKNLTGSKGGPQEGIERI